MIGFMLTGSFIAGVTGAAVATPAPTHPIQVAAATTGQPGLAGWSPVQEKPKKAI